MDGHGPFLKPQWTTPVRGLLLVLGLLTVSAAQAAELRFQITGAPDALRARLEQGMPPAPLVKPPAGLSDAKMAADLRLRQALEAYGYYDARWQEHLVRREGDYILIFALELGTRILVRNVVLHAEGSGSDLPVLRELFATFPLRHGAALDQPLYDDWKAKTLNALRAEGYARADFSRHEILINRKERWADILLTVNSGSVYRFGAVSFRGAETYPPHFLTRYLDFSPGDRYSPDRLAQTQANFRNADRFSVIAVLPDLRQAKDGRIPVTVLLKPLRPKRLKVGVGYSSDLGDNLGLGYDDYNAFRRGQHLHLSVTLAQRTLDVATSYIWPVGDRLGSQYIVQASYRHLDLIPYSANVFDTGLGRDWHMGGGANLGALLSYQNITYSIGGVSGRGRFVVPSLRYSVQGFFNPVRPVEGYSWDAVIQGGARTLASDADFVQMRVHGVWRHLVGSEWGVGLQGEAGATWLPGSIDRLPPTLRYFAGGQGTLPGYAFLSQGPELNGVVVGGRDLLVVGAEVERFIGRDWGVVAFYHAGNAFNGFAEFPVLQDVGLGVRWYSPFGPVRLDVAHPLIGSGAPFARVVFSVGVAL